VPRLIAYSDYLCPWCLVAAVRLRKLQQEVDGVEVEWRSFLLRPEPPSYPRNFEEFRRYTQSWQKPAAEEPDAGFVPWSSDEGPPTWSVPPHRVAKAAARIDRAAGEALHDSLFDAYFRRSRDITDDRVLLDLWRRAGLDPARFDEREDPELLRLIGEDYEEALAHGASGAPAVRMDGAWGVLMGAQPLAVYRRWVEKVAAHV
jgi:predicted DsbA family dithiol-disulfide isomerase